MPEVVILSLGDRSRPGGCAGGTGEGAGDGCGCGGGEVARVPVLRCAEALRAAGASIETVTACEDAEIDAAIKPVTDAGTRLIVAAATDGEVRAVVRRLVRRAAPPPSKRPAELPPNRTVFDLPPMGILPLTPGVPDLVRALALPEQPGAVAEAALAGQVRRLDLLRTDAGSVTLHGSLLGGAEHAREAGGWHGRIEVDDVVLSDGTEPILACSVRNLGSSAVDGLPLVEAAAGDDGLVHVAVAVPKLTRRLLRPAAVHVEVRRARGRAVSVSPTGEVPLVDDSVRAALTRKRAWWIEAGAWGVYVT
ncbi:MAG TPA: diacylglycerol kinase family protein [Micromonosporaceae bacterium]